MTPRLLSRCLGLALSLAGAAGASTPAPAGSRPALVVVITIDQFRGDSLARLGGLLGPGGFRLLLEAGANFTDCRYRHAITKTAAGHAVILTGVHANEHGIINNAWIDRQTLQRVNCVDDPTAQIVGRAPPAPGVRPPAVLQPAGASPARLLATTVGDELKIATGGRARVIGLAGKDRSAILLAGKLGDSAYWMEKGRFVTSTHYRKELPPWVRTFNEAGRIDACFGRIWDRVVSAAACEALVGPDDAPGEATDYGLPRTLPKRVDGGADTITPAFYDAFENSPFHNQVFFEFARAVVTHENLGGRGVTDLLGLSLSANDKVGHSYGPDSHEFIDMTVRTDRLLAEFFRFLDARVGLARCLIVLTADHGIAPLPERVAGLGPGVSAGRVDNARLLQVCEGALDRAFGALGAGKRWLVADENSLLFQHGVLRDKGVEAARAEQVVKEALLTLEFVAEAHTRTDLRAGRAAGASGEAARLSFHAERSGDVYYQVKPYWVERKSGTNHGSPYVYDVHVPLLWFGAGVKPGTQAHRVGVDDLAPTLAHLMGVPAPPRSRGRVLF